MSILIKGMEMPKSCVDCNMPMEWCNKWIGVENGKRSEDCPLVPVPPHGRLIDADALLKEAEVPATLFPSGRGLRLEVWTHAVASGDVINAPTIIPESEERER